MQDKTITTFSTNIIGKTQMTMNKACIEPVESISIISRAMSPIEFLFF